MIKKIYIAGELTQERQEALKRLSDKMSNVEFIVPSAYVPPDSDWKTSMETRAELIPTCHFIYMLKNWHNSPNAKWELHEAMRHRLVIAFEDAEDIKTLFN